MQCDNNVSSPEKSQLSLSGLVTGPGVTSVMEAGGTPCTPGDPLTQLHHKHKVSQGAIKIKDCNILCPEGPFGLWILSNE